MEYTETKQRKGQNKPLKFDYRTETAGEGEGGKQELDVAQWIILDKIEALVGGYSTINTFEKV